MRSSTEGGEGERPYTVVSNKRKSTKQEGREAGKVRRKAGRPKAAPVSQKNNLLLYGIPKVGGNKVVPAANTGNIRPEIRVGNNGTYNGAHNGDHVGAHDGGHAGAHNGARDSARKGARDGAQDGARDGAQDKGYNGGQVGAHNGDQQEHQNEQEEL